MQKIYKHDEEISFNDAPENSHAEGNHSGEHYVQKHIMKLHPINLQCKMVYADCEVHTNNNMHCVTAFCEREKRAQCELQLQSMQPAPPFTVDAAIFQQ